MTDRIGLLAGIGFLSVGFLLFIEEDATRTIWLVISGLLFGLGVVTIWLVAKNWLHWRREWKAYRAPE